MNNIKKRFLKDISKIQRKLSSYRERGLKVFATSSFQTNSVVLLHILSQIDKTIPIYMLNTGYLFPETLQFKEKLVELLGINVIELTSYIPKIQQRDNLGQLIYASDTDHCCYLNKVQPLEPILIKNDVWISGVRATQSSARAKMKEEERTPTGEIRYHPILHFSNKDVYDYLRVFDLPKHPLENEGYSSIGCQPCTTKYIFEIGREGRWKGLNKTECGLHTELISK